MSTPSAQTAETLFFGSGFYSFVAQAIGGESSDAWNQQQALWMNQYNALDRSDLGAVEAWRAHIAAVLTGSQLPDVAPLNSNGQGPYTGPIKPRYANLSGMPTLQAMIEARNAPIVAVADAKASYQNYGNILTQASSAIAAAEAASAANPNDPSLPSLNAAAAQASERADAAYADMQKIYSSAMTAGADANQLPFLPTPPSSTIAVATYAHDQGNPQFINYVAPSWYRGPRTPPWVR
jgi:hypothetical protein